MTAERHWFPSGRCSWCFNAKCDGGYWLSFVVGYGIALVDDGGQGAPPLLCDDCEAYRLAHDRSGFPKHIGLN